MDPNVARLALVHEPNQGDRGALLVGARYALVLQLGLVQVIDMDQLVPG